MTTQTRRRASRPRKADPTSLYVRGFEPGVVREIQRRAGSRNFTMSRYISQLVALHARMLEATDNPQMRDMLDGLYLGRVET
jgi:hypothetical protein